MERNDIGNFFEYCKDFIKDRLPLFEGYDVDTCDLGIEITDEINVNGSITHSYEDAKDYIHEWFEEAAEYWEFEKLNFGEHLHNPFDNPEAYMVCMVIEGVRAILGDCKTISDNWNDEIALTKETIEKILSEVDEQTEPQCLF
jgi:hypothetical protein